MQYIAQLGTEAPLKTTDGDRRYSDYYTVIARVRHPVTLPPERGALEASPLVGVIDGNYER